MSEADHGYALIDGDGGDSATLAETLVALAERVATALDCFECCIYEHLPELDALRCQAIWSRELSERDREWVGQVNHLNALPGFSEAFASGEVFVQYPEQDVTAAAEAETMAYWGELAALYAPILHEGETLGILELTERRERRGFGDGDLKLVKQMAGLTGVALHNARESRTAQTRNRHLSALIESARTMSSTLVFEELLEAVCRQVAEALDAPSSYIYEYDAESATVTWLAHYESDPDREFEEPLGTVYPIADYPHDRKAIETLSVVQVSLDDEDLEPELREQMEGWGDKSAMMIPLAMGEHVVGCLEVTETRHVRRFTDEETQLAKALGEQAGAALHNAQLYRRAEQQNRRLQALLDSSRAIGSTVVLEEVLDRVGEQAARAVNAPSCYIYEYDSLSDEVTWRSHYQRDPSVGQAEPVGTAYPLDDFPWDRVVLRSGSPSHVTLDDDGLDPRLRASMLEWSERTLLTVPLLFGAEPVGLLEIAETGHARQFTADEIDLVQAIGEQAAIAIHNARLYRRETWRNERLVRVLEISRAVGSSLDAAEVAEGLRAQVGRLFSDAPATVSVRLLPAGADGAATSAEPDEAVAAALEQQRPLQAPGSEGCHRLLVPLVQKAAVVGYIEIIGGGSRGFAEDEVELVQLLANQAAASVDNARLYETIERQAVTDGLTGLYNHRHFFDRLRAEVIRARRYDFAVSVLMLDLDDFKSFNDRFGHPAGDRVLRAVGDLLQTQLRKDIDLAARYGGEEFAVILPHTPTPGAGTVGRRLSGALMSLPAGPGGELEGARITGERVRRTIADAELPLLDGGSPAHVTASVGAATLPAHAVDADELVSKADQALYTAKQLGKNRVELYVPA